MLKHVFFDLDNTLTPSKSVILPEHVPILKKLCETADVIVVSGHGAKDIHKNLGNALKGMYHVLGQNGNRAEMRDGTVLWNHSLSQQQKDAIFSFIAKARKLLNLKVRNENDIVEDRDSQIAFSLIGHHEDHDKKEAFDPGGKKRLKLLRDMADDVKLLEKAKVEVRIGGTTNLDIFQLGMNKGYNVPVFIEKMGWKKEDSIYIGDALFPGGNDETVIGKIPTHAIANYKETYIYIDSLLKSQT